MEHLQRAWDNITVYRLGPTGNTMKLAPGRIDGFIADVDNQIRSSPTSCLFDPCTGTPSRSRLVQRLYASGPKRNDITYGAAAKSVIVTSDYKWSDHEVEWRQQRDNTPKDIRSLDLL